MNKESVEIVPVDVSNTALSGLNAQRLIDVKAQREQLKHFIKSQLVSNTDFGVIPGTRLPSLYKPGAEKLAKLFSLGKRIIAKDKEINLKENFAMFSYTVEIYHLGSGQVVAQLEGSSNTLEQRYQRKDGKDVPIANLLNTVQKMAQKRAFVGAVIEAVGASDFYTQDIDDVKDAAQLGICTPVSMPGNQTTPFDDLPVADTDKRKQRNETGGTAPGSFVVGFKSDWKGKTLAEMGKEVVSKELSYWSGVERKQQKPLTGPVKEFVDAARLFLQHGG